jgi:hypothetical protein
MVKDIGQQNSACGTSDPQEETAHRHGIISLLWANIRSIAFINPLGKFVSIFIIRIEKYPHSHLVEGGFFDA